MRYLFPRGQKYISVYKQLKMVTPLQNVYTSVTWKKTKVFNNEIDDTKMNGIHHVLKWRVFQTAKSI
jgi:hypothetical protein